MALESRKSRLQKFAQLDNSDKWLFLRAVGWLALARIRLSVTSFSSLAEALARKSGPLGSEADPELLNRIGFAVRAAANNVPWRSDCFPQAIAARKLLQGHGFGSTIHLGVAKSGDDVLTGHAWLTCGDIVVTGGGTMDRYTEVHRL